MATVEVPVEMLDRLVWLASWADSGGRGYYLNNHEADDYDSVLGVRQSDMDLVEEAAKLLPPREMADKE
jgi:hypothetical protein